MLKLTYDLGHDYGTSNGVNWRNSLQVTVWTMAAASGVPVNILGADLSEQTWRASVCCNSTSHLKEGGTMLAVVTNQAVAKEARRKRPNNGYSCQEPPSHPWKEALGSLDWLLPHTRHNLPVVVAITREQLSQFSWFQHSHMGKTFKMACMPLCKHSTRYYGREGHGR